VILYIEDNPANLKLVERILSRRQQVKLISAATGSLGYEMAISHQPDLILLDINLPGMSGFEVMEQLKQQSSMQQKPVIALSANAMPKDIARGLAAGFSHYLTKPIDITAFNAIIDHMISQHTSSETPL